MRSVRTVCPISVSIPTMRLWPFMIQKLRMKPFSRLANVGSPSYGDQSPGSRLPCRSPQRVDQALRPGSAIRVKRASSANVGQSRCFGLRYQPPSNPPWNGRIRIDTTVGRDSTVMQTRSCLARLTFDAPDLCLISNSATFSQVLTQF
jgi:hypothetical protein